MNGFGEIGRNGRFGTKWQFVDRFGAKMAKTIFFRKNPKMSLPYTYEAATLYKKLEKFYQRILRSSSNGRTDESEFIGPISATRGTKNKRGSKGEKNNKRVRGGRLLGTPEYPYSYNQICKSKKYQSHLLSRAI